MTDFTCQAVGSTGLLIQLGSTPGAELSARIVALDRAIDAAGLTGVRETIPALVNLMILYDPLVTDPTTLEAQISALTPETDVAGAACTHTLPVCYDTELSPDILQVAQQTGLDPEAVIAAHVTSQLRVAMYGFAPGYAYLSGVPEAIQVPRKPAALRDVPAGSVMIAGEQSLVTTLTMPTGWSIIGRCPLLLMDSGAARPFLFDVGDTVTFHRIGRGDLPADMARP